MNLNAINPDTVMACVVTGLITATVVGAAASLFSCYFAESDCRKALEAIGKQQQLDYTVVPVPQGLEETYRKIWPLAPTFEQFAQGMLGNPDYQPWHDAIKAAAKRYAIEYAGSTLFVMIRRMP